MFQAVRVGPRRLTFEARTVSGALYDRFTLVKRAKLPNQIINQIPPGTERLRPPKQ